jgi:hypothetical protein
MADLVAIKNDLCKSLDFVRAKSEKVYFALLDILQPKITQLEEDGIHDVLLLLSNITDFVVVESAGDDLDHEFMWFHVFESDKEGAAVNPIVFIVMDFTDETAYDSSENIKTFTRH